MHKPGFEPAKAVLESTVVKKVKLSVFPGSQKLSGLDTQFLVNIPETDDLSGQLEITDIVHFIRRYIAMIMTGPDTS